MKIGQMSIPKISEKADYLQLDICGLSIEDSVNRYKKYKTNIPVILHGDWSKKGASENNLKERIYDYINTIKILKEITLIYGITIHPPTRKTMSLYELIEYCQKIKYETGVDVFIENRSNKRILLSTPDEIISFSRNNLMTIDIPQLYISCGYDTNKLMNTLKNITMKNIKEIHLANLLRKDKNTLVARKLDDGDLDIKTIFKYLNHNAYYTLEILGGVPNFEKQKNILLNFK